MSERVTVKSFGNPNPWQHGITFYDVVFDRGGQDFACSWGKKGDPPTVGEEVEGDFRQQNGDWKFSKASAPQSSGGSSGGGGSSGKREWKPESQYDPEKVARISRAHSQEMAVRVLVGVEGFNAAPKEKRREALRDWADFFDTDLATAALKASFNATETATGAGAASPGNGSTGSLPPVDSPGPAQSVYEDDPEIPFARPEYPPLFSERERWSNRP